jgi:hypothetical protein
MIGTRVFTLGRMECPAPPSDRNIVFAMTRRLPDALYVRFSALSGFGLTRANDSPIYAVSTLNNLVKLTVIAPGQSAALLNRGRGSPDDSVDRGLRLKTCRSSFERRQHRNCIFWPCTGH